MSKESGILIIGFTCHCFSPLSINHHYLCPGANLHMNNPKTLKNEPVAQRMEQGYNDLLKHKKANICIKILNLNKYKGQLFPLGSIL